MFDKMSNIQTQITSLGRRQQGAVAVVVILFPVLVGCLTLAVDLNRAAQLQAKVQNQADLAALAGANHLDQTDGSRERAIEAAAGAMSQVTNLQRHADTSAIAGVIGNPLDVPVQAVTFSADIRFYSDMESMVHSTTDADAHVIEVVVQPRRVSYFFKRLISQITEANPIGRAMAGEKRLTGDMVDPQNKPRPDKNRPADDSTV